MKTILTILIFFLSGAMFAQKENELDLNKLTSSDTIRLVVKRIGDAITYIDDEALFFIYKNKDSIKTTAYFFFEKDWTEHTITLTNEQQKFLQQLQKKSYGHNSTGLAHDEYEWTYRNKVYKARIDYDSTNKLFDYFNIFENEKN